tara:strand:- start:1911 stop:2165 length:255 start_codon:yes stop_codon:yes gene_type:complete
MSELETLKKKIIYRSSYRGTKEMDILLSSFVKMYINNMSERELNDLYNFLNLEDDVIYSYYKKGDTNNIFKKNHVTELFKKFRF